MVPNSGGEINPECQKDISSSETEGKEVKVVVDAEF